MNTEDIDITTLRQDALGVRPVRRDWSEGYGESWDFIEVPVCDLCGEIARWDADAEEWRCPEHETYELWPGASPMVSYAYSLPSLGDARDEYDAADRIHDLPLCVVRWDDGSWELALTSSGMDMTWEIAEAYMRLGFLPPFEFCNLPAMADRGESERDRKIIEVCRTAALAYAEHIDDVTMAILRSLDRIAGDE